MQATYTFSDQPSFDWKLVLWTGRTLVSPFHSRYSMILEQYLNTFPLEAGLTHFKSVTRATPRDTGGVFPT
jgi:hypothetical protein